MNPEWKANWILIFQSAICSKDTNFAVKFNLQMLYTEQFFPYILNQYQDLCYPPKAETQTSALINLNKNYHTQPHPIIVY